MTSRKNEWERKSGGPIGLPGFFFVGGGFAGAGGGGGSKPPPYGVLWGVRYSFIRPSVRTGAPSLGGRLFGGDFIGGMAMGGIMGASSAEIKKLTQKPEQKESGGQGFEKYIQALEKAGMLPDKAAFLDEVKEVLFDAFSGFASGTVSAAAAVGGETAKQYVQKTAKVTDAESYARRLQEVMPELMQKNQLNATGKSQNTIEKQGKSSIIKGVSGARISDPWDVAAEQHAERYYGLVRKMSTDVQKIARVTGYSEEIIQSIKNYIFVDEHDLGENEIRRFDPNFAMAQSWQRLAEGHPEPHDLTMIQHEIMESELVSNGMTQDEAHIIASEKYNYGKESDEYYGSLKEHTKKR